MDLDFDDFSFLVGGCATEPEPEPEPDCTWLFGAAAADCDSAIITATGDWCQQGQGQGQGLPGSLADFAGLAFDAGAVDLAALDAIVPLVQ